MHKLHIDVGCIAYDSMIAAPAPPIAQVFGAPSSSELCLCVACSCSSLARTHLFFPVFGEVNSKTGTPIYATLFVMVATLPLAILTDLPPLIDMCVIMYTDTCGLVVCHSKVCRLGVKQWAHVICLQWLSQAHTALNNAHALLPGLLAVVSAATHYDLVYDCPCCPFSCVTGSAQVSSQQKAQCS